MNQIRLRSRSIRIVYVAGFVFLVASLSWFGLEYIVTHAEGSRQGHVAANVIAALAGNPARMTYAHFLVKQGIAPDIMSTLVDPICLREGGPRPACATRVRNTIDEAVVLRRIFDHEGFTRAIVVTSDYHLARATAIFDIIFVGSGIELHFVASPEAQLTQKQVSREVSKYLPSLAGAVLVRFVPALYSWSLWNRPVCQDSVNLSCN
jgi:hypothetical protein